MRQFIRFDATSKRFHFCSETVSLKTLGGMLAWALLNGKDVLLPFCERDRTRDRFKRRSWGVEVKPSYVEQMLRFAQAHGWFWDEVPEYKGRKDSDHDFDPANVTPGTSWRIVTEMRLGADQMESQAKGYEIEAEWREHRRKKKEILAQAAALRARAAQTRLQAEALLANSVPPC